MTLRLRALAVFGAVPAALLCAANPAAAQLFTRDVDLPGAVAAGAPVCLAPSDVSFGLGPTCTRTPIYHETPVTILQVDADVTTIRLKGLVMYADSAFVVVQIDPRRRLSMHHYLMQQDP